MNLGQSLHLCLSSPVGGLGVMSVSLWCYVCVIIDLASEADLCYRWVKVGLLRTAIHAAPTDVNGMKVVSLKRRSMFKLATSNVTRYAVIIHVFYLKFLLLSFSLPYFPPLLNKRVSMFFLFIE